MELMRNLQYVHRHLPTSFNDLRSLWIGYPHHPLAGPIKFYYLFQTASYTHQMLVLNAEARRKDHWQMMAHHVITIVLLVLSYFTNFTRVGCMILFLMDWCDIFLPVCIFRHLSTHVHIADIPRLARQNDALCSAPSNSHRLHVWLLHDLLAGHQAHPLPVCSPLCLETYPRCHVVWRRRDAG